MTLGNPNSKQTTIEKVWFNLKKEYEQTFPVEALSTQFICLPVKNQIINFPKTCFDYLKVQIINKLYNRKYMIVSTQLRNPEIFAFIAALVFKLLSRKVLFIIRKDNRNW